MEKVRINAGRFPAGKLDVTIRTTDIPANLPGMLYANLRTGYVKWSFPTWFILCLFVMELLFFQIFLGAALMPPTAIALPVLIADSAAAVALSLLAGAFIRRFLPFIYGKIHRK